MLTLNTDFSPTKWSAISTMRGYPSVYEVPGTETDVTSITTDASAGTNDIGSSPITVTTAGAHGFEIFVMLLQLKVLIKLLQVIVEVKVHLLLSMYSKRY